MKKQSSGRLKATALSSLVILAMLIGVGLDRVLLQAGVASDRFSTASNYSIIGETYDLIRDYYVLSDDITDEELVWGAANGMMEALGDTNHSVFLNPSDTQLSRDAETNQFVGVGILINTEGDYPLIQFVYKNSPALAAGLLPGDEIVGVDGEELPRSDADKAADKIRGEAGTDVTLTIRREGSEDLLDFTITRALISTDPVSYAMLPDGVLWLKLDGFTRGSSQRVDEALQWGLDNGMTGLILDLRDNGGGFVVEAVAIISEFVPDNTPILQEKTRDGVSGTTSSIGDNGRYLDGPMVVLANERSASAAEITSAALQESGRADLVGITTAGTGTVLLPFDLSDGSSANVGVSLFLTGHGTDIYGVGVHPTWEVEFVNPDRAYPQYPYMLVDDGEELTSEQVEALMDTQLNKALDLLGDATP